MVRIGVENMTKEQAKNYLRSSGFSEEQINEVVKALEPTTKNNLGADLISRQFQEIVVEYPPEDLCTYPEFRGKPYFSIKYKEGNDYIIGYGTYNPKVLSRYLTDYFMPSVTPQEPKIVTIAEIKYDKDKLKELVNKAVLTVTPQEPRKGYLSIDDVMSVFDDFMCGEVDEEGTETFLEMLIDKAESEG